jgi:hypothetical protein
MRKFFMVALTLMLLSSCKKDAETTQTGSTPVAVSGKVSHSYPLKLNFYTSEDPDPSIPPTACSGDLPNFANAGYFLHGTSTLLGQIQPTYSRGQDVTCNLSFATALLTTTVGGQITGADSDIIYYTGSDIINVLNLLTGAGTSGTITGVWTITGGTGKFAGATGSINISGTVDFLTKTLKFGGEGSISF